jgi:hypothetical protein
VKRTAETAKLIVRESFPRSGRLGQEEIQMPVAKRDEQPRTFAVRPTHDGGHQVHSIAGLTFQEAALTFVEHWSPPVDADHEVSVMVVDRESGEQQCFRFNLETGEAGPCA